MYDELIKRLRRCSEFKCRECEYEAVMGCRSKLNAEAADAIAALTAADVRPVVRGRWEKCVGENGVTSACRCSLCGFEDNRFSVFNYCPNCGADMREES